MGKIAFKTLSKTPKKTDEGDVPPVDYNKYIHSKIPWKGISLAIFLTTTGFGLLIMGILSQFGYLDQKFDDRTSAFLMLGLLMFIPGAYHVRIAYLAYTGTSNYSFDDIPDFD